MKKPTILLVIVLLLAGCAVGPDYKRPAVDVPQSFRFEDKEAKDLANTAWWQQFNDPVLNDLIQIALQENKDVKVAASRIEQFVGQYVSTRSALFPQIRGRRFRRNATVPGERVCCPAIRQESQ